MFESLDSDKEDRMLSPIYILSEESNFNNTLNTMMDHCWDGHYTCQKRLSRFPGLVELNKAYEIYYSGTTPASTRYMIQGGDTGDYLKVKVDFSKSILYKVFADDVEVTSKRYDQTSKAIPALTGSECGENRYEQLTYVYEFYIMQGCIVRLQAQEHMIGLARLQMSIDEFFSDDFVSKLSFALGITTDQIRVVSTQTGSTIVYFQLTSSESTETQQRSNLVELSDMLASRHASGTLDLGAPILDLVTSVITSSGVVVTSGTGNYVQKTVHVSVYILLAISAIAVLAGIIYGIVKVAKMSKSYKEISNIEATIDEGEGKSNLSANKVGENNFEIIEEAKVES